MQITPLVLHAAMRLPVLTARFSDALAATSMTVTPGGNVVITLAAAHGQANGTKMAIAITDAAAPNGIDTATVQDDGDILLETAYEHDLTTAPSADVEAWDAFVTLSGFADAVLNGSRQLIAVPDRTHLVIRPGGPVETITLGGGEVLLERLPSGVTGWHAATVTGASQLSFPAPASATRALTVANPVIVRNIRTWGAVDFEIARRKFVTSDNLMALATAHLFVCPREEVRISRSKFAQTDAIQDVNEGTDLRQTLIDGFDVYVFLPSQSSPGAVAPCDLCQGPLFTAMMKTFNGLNLPRPELASGYGRPALLEAHGAIYFDGAVYAHRYRFASTAVYTEADAIRAWEAADTSGFTPGETPPDTITPIDAPVLNGVDFTGILHDSQPQPLTGSITLETP